MQRRLQDAGFKVADGGLTFTIMAEEQNTGKTIDYRIQKMPGFGPPPPPPAPFSRPPFGGPIRPPFGGPIGPQMPSTETVQLQDIEIFCQVIISGPQGEELQKVEHRTRTPFALTFKSDDYQAELSAAVWNQAVSWGLGITLPNAFYRINGEVVGLPKTGPFPTGG